MAEEQGQHRGAGSNQKLGQGSFKAKFSQGGFKNKSSQNWSDKNDFRNKSNKGDSRNKSSQNKRGEASPNTVFIGKKGTMAYVLGVMTQMNQGQTEVLIKARGKSISTAVDVAEVVKNKPENDVKIAEINTSTEAVTSSDGKNLRISSIEIKMVKNK